MIEQPIWDMIKDLTSWLWVPIGAVFTWIFKDYSTHKSKTDDLERRVAILEIQYNDMKEDLTSIREGVDRLVSHLLNKK